MSCAERRDRLYDRLYGLLEETDAAELDRHVAACPDCRREWEALRNRDALLDAWTPAYRPAAPVRFARPRRAPGLAWAAAALLITVATAFLFPASGAYEAAGTALVPGSRIAAATGTTIRLGRAGRVELEPGAVLVYRSGGADSDHDLALEAGTAHVDVFPTGRAFRVAVGDRTVEVRGTRFTVQRLDAPELALVLGEDSMKRWNLASVSVALVTVTTGTVVLTGPDGHHPVEAGRTVLASPAGVDWVDGAESLADVRKVRDELLRSLAAREEKNRATRDEVEALKAKTRKGKLPPGATLESLLAGLRAALAKGVADDIQEGIALLGLLLETQDAAFDGALKALRESRDATFSSLLCHAMWQSGVGRVYAHRAEILKLFLAADLPVDLRAVIVNNLRATFYATKVSDAEGAQLLRAAQALAGATGVGAELRSHLAAMAMCQTGMAAESWGEFQRYLAAETDDSLRRTVLRDCFQISTNRQKSPAAEALLLDTIRGRYGAAAAFDPLEEPLLPWITAGNADAFVRSLREGAALTTEPALRQATAGQLGLLYLIQRNASALDAIRHLQTTETDDAARARLGDVLQAADKNTLDLDKLMDKLQLRWNF